MKTKIREFAPYNPDSEGFPTGKTDNVPDTGNPTTTQQPSDVPRAGDYNKNTSCGCTQNQSSTFVDQTTPEPNSPTWLGLSVYPDFRGLELQGLEGWNGYVKLPQEGWDIRGDGGTQGNNTNATSSIYSDLLPSELNINEALLPRKKDNKFIKKNDPIADDPDPIESITLDLPEILGHAGSEYHFGEPKERPHMVIDAEEESELVDEIDENRLTEIQVNPMGRYKYHGHEGDEDVCKKLDGSVWDMADPRRPIVPSEGAGVVNTHPNCKCTWEYFTDIDTDPKSTKKIKTPMSKRGRPLADESVKGLSIKHLRKVNKIINRKLSTGELHQIDNKGKVLDKKFGETVRRLTETVRGLRNEAEWLTDDYVEKIKSVSSTGAWLLIRASAETITDHRGEGEPYPRLLHGDELHAMARTAIGHGMDINHYGEDFRTQAVIADSEYNKGRREIQMLVHEDDEQIIEAIYNGTIQAVSINGGAPRHEEIAECDHPAGFCTIPRGVVLGELDDIALTYVVTNPHGFNWVNARGEIQNIPMATPGVASTAIEIL